MTEGPVGGVGELTTLVELLHKRLDVFEIAAKNHLYQRDVLSVVAAVRPIVDELAALAAKAPQGVLAYVPADCPYCAALWELDKKTMKHRHPSVSGFGAFAYPCEPAPERKLPVPVSDDTIHQGRVPAQIICRKLDAVAQHLNLKGRPQSLDIATAVRLVEEGAEWAAKHIEERGRELDKLRATLNKVAKDIDGTSPNGESIARERIQSVLRPKPAPHPAQMALEHNRSEVAECVTAMKNTLKNYSWLLDGRGSYEWDDDRYRAEFQTVCTAMQKHVEVLARIAADWSNCPEELEDILAARDEAAAPKPAPPAPTKETIMDIVKRAHELVEAHSMPLGTKEPTSWPCKIACKCGTQIEAINRDALTLMFVNHVVMEALADRHASAERVRELIAKWRDRVENAPKAFAGPRRPIGDLNRFDALNRFERRMLGWCAGELERALPPSTGEKVSGATSPAKDGDAQ